MNSYQVSWAQNKDLEQIAPLFDAYRQFYLKAPNLALSQQLLKARFEQQQSKIAILSDHQNIVGFIQLYPLYSSLADSLETSTPWLLNDMFVTPTHRGGGGAEQLMNFVLNWAKSEQLSYLMLETAKTNATAQKLYERCGWVQDSAFFVYHWLPSSNIQI